MLASFILAFIFTVGYLCGLLTHYLWVENSKKKTKPLVEETKYPQFEGSDFKVKFFMKNNTDITIQGMTWDGILTIRKYMDKIQGQRGVLNQNFQKPEANTLRSQIDLDEVVYIEYSKSIT